ncbi:MAG: thiamine phosphate synthase [Myxococcales bacterium]|nr:thiamine phosphate synthase [Myxococcales bacterium]
MTPDLSLYLVTDPHLLRGRNLIDTCEAAVAGGVTLVQLRDKTAEARDLLEMARGLTARLAPHGVPVIVNDRVDVAAAAGCGCHLGQRDVPLAAARAILGPDAVIGVSVSTVAQAREAAAATYLAPSPVFATTTRSSSADPLGISGLKAIVQATDHPVVAIGGISLDNAEAIGRTGAAGLATITALMRTPDIGAAAGALRRAFAAGRARRA